MQACPSEKSQKCPSPESDPSCKAPQNVFCFFFFVFLKTHENFRPENLTSSSSYDLLALKIYRKGFPTFLFSNNVAIAVALFVHIWRLSHYMKMMEKTRRRPRHQEELRSGLRFQTFASVNYLQKRPKFSSVSRSSSPKYGVTEINFIQPNFQAQKQDYAS